MHPEIREADLGTYCVGGPAHSPHVLAQVRVAPNERIELELELQAGSYRLRGPQLPWSVDFQVQNSATIRRWDIDLGSAPPPERVGALRTGGQILILSNPHPRELVIRVERTATRGDALTAARATSMALFRELFPGEVLAPGQLATVSMVTLMVTALDPQQADALYGDLGDARASAWSTSTSSAWATPIRAGGGAVVKTMGEGVLASFNDVEAAVRTALDLVPRLATRPGDTSASPAGRHSPGHDPGRHAQRSTRLLRHDGPAGRGHIAICPRRRAGSDPARGGRSRGCRFAQCTPHRGRSHSGRASRATALDPGAVRFPFPTRMIPAYPGPCRVFPHPPSAFTARLLPRDRCFTRIKTSTCQISCKERRPFSGSGRSFSCSAGQHAVCAGDDHKARPADAQPQSYNPPIAPASDEALKAIPSFRVPAGLKVELFAAEPMLANPVAFCIDEKGVVYVAETFRLHAGVTDTRNHMNWLDDDLACRTVADRVAMYKKFLGNEFASYNLQHDRVRRIVDRDGDGRADGATVFADGFNDAASGIGAGVLARNNDVWFTCIPWSLEARRSRWRRPGGKANALARRLRRSRRLPGP